VYHEIVTHQLENELEFDQWRLQGARVGAKGGHSKSRQERPAVADKPARRLRNVCTVYVRAAEL